MANVLAVERKRSKRLSLGPATVANKALQGFPTKNVGIIYWGEPKLCLS